MKYVILTLLVLAMVGIGFFFGPTIWAQGKGISRTGKGKFGNFSVEIQRHGRGCAIPADEQADAAYDDLRESLTEIDGEAREFRGEIEAFIGDLGRSISEIEKQLRRSSVRVESLGAAVGEDAAGRARVETLRAAQASRERMLQALQAIKARIAESAQEWEKVITEAGAVEIPEAPAQVQPEESPAVVEADQPLDLPAVEDGAQTGQDAAPRSDSVGSGDREAEAPGEMPGSGEEIEETEF